MGKRRTSRRLAMQAIYQAEAAGIEIDEALKNLLKEEEFIKETVSFAKELSSSAWKNRFKHDGTISELSIDWPLERIGRVDRSILRLAIEELDLAETPPSVVIDEAVELAKRYSSNESAKFINGILGTYLKKLRK